MRLLRGTEDITDIVGQITWAGEYNNCARTLEFNIVSSETDRYLSKYKCEIMDDISFYPDKDLKFKGKVWEREKATGESSFNVTCFDNGIYMKKNQISIRFSSTTPEQIAKSLCNKYSFKIGSLAKTNYSISRNFFGKTIYDVIMTAYTLAAKETGKKYQAYFIGDNFYVQPRGENSERVVIEGGTNLMSATVSETATNIITRVKIYDEDNNFVKNVDSNEALKIYGLLQRVVSQSKDSDGRKEANELLKNDSIEQKITVENLGDSRLITGNSIIVKEPYTGVYGLFYVDSDVHTWKNGQYYNRLVLNFKKIMDEKEVGANAG